MFEERRFASIARRSVNISEAEAAYSAKFVFAQRRADDEQSAEGVRWQLVEHICISATVIGMDGGGVSCFSFMGLPSVKQQTTCEK